MRRPIGKSRPWASALPGFAMHRVVTQLFGLPQLGGQVPSIIDRLPPSSFHRSPLQMAMEHDHRLLRFLDGSYAFVQAVGNGLGWLGRARAAVDQCDIRRLLVLPRDALIELVFRCRLRLRIDYARSTVLHLPQRRPPCWPQTRWRSRLTQMTENLLGHRNHR